MSPVSDASILAATFDEAAAIDLVAEALIKGVRVRAVIAARDLDTDATMTPDKKETARPR
jgi:hypothetical protein